VGQRKRVPKEVCPKGGPAIDVPIVLSTRASCTAGETSGVQEAGIPKGGTKICVPQGGSTNGWQSSGVPIGVNIGCPLRCVHQRGASERMPQQGGPPRCPSTGVPDGVSRK
jgi:hypothetical protein